MVAINDDLKITNYFDSFDEIANIGSGAFSSVFKARDKKTNVYFAIKKIPIKLTDETQVKKELDFLAKLDSIYIIKIINYWKEGNYYGGTDFYIPADAHNNVSSYNIVNRQNMTHLLHIQTDLYPLTLRGVISQLTLSEFNESTKSLSINGYFVAGFLFTELLNGVYYLHHECSPPVIHRDLKPGNVLVSNGSNGAFIKICDFGLATEHEFERQSHSSRIGTRQYMAPEVSLTRKYDTKADIFSLGVTLEKLFLIDINKQTKPFETLLQPYYTKLHELYSVLIHTRPNKRLSCEQVLRNLNAFVLSVEEFKRQKEFSDISTDVIAMDNNLDTNFIEYFLQKIKQRD